MRVRWFVVPAFAAALTAAMTLSGCSDSGSATTPESEQSKSQQSENGDKSAEPANNDSGEKDDTTASFKEAVSYKDGLKVEISAIDQGKIGEYAVGGKPGSDQTTFTIRITNGSKEPFDATLAVPSATYGEAGTTAEIVTDEKVGGGFTGKILPGKSMSAPWAFAIPKKELGNVTLQLELAVLDKEPAIFTGSAQ
jgi:hypothetical protein